MKTVNLRLAEENDLTNVLELDSIKRNEVIKSAIGKSECFLIVAEKTLVGFMIFNYNFFGRGFIDLMVINKTYRRFGYGSAAIKEIFKFCKTEKLFTSTNESNEPMIKLLAKLEFIFAGTVGGLDKDDHELFYYKILR